MTEKSEKVLSENWHAIDAGEVLDKLQSDIKNGLNSGEALKRQEKYGKNVIPRGKQRSAWVRLLVQFHNVLIYVLIGAALITAFLGHWIDTWVILAVIIVNAVIGFIQEGKAEKALEGIRKMLSLNAVVKRDGSKKTINAEELVPGDIVLLKSGDKVPADIRLFQSKDLSVEESPLTGESTPVEKNTEPVDQDAIIADQSCMTFSSTLVTYGNASGVVVHTGASTEIGKINQMISDVEEVTTPLLQQIEKFGKWLSLIILIITGIFFAFGYFFRDYSMDDLFLSAIGLIVASIPEGLPAIMTITLAIGVQRMASRNAIIRRLPSVETLGSINVICSDKTGTLTRNEMTVKTIITAEKKYGVEGIGYNPEGSIFQMDNNKEIVPEQEKVLWQFLKTIRTSNNSEITQDDSGGWKLTGTPTDGALLALSYKAGLKDIKIKRIDTIPFESEHKYMATLNRSDDDLYAFITGAPEILVGMCNKNLTSEGEKEIDREFWNKKMDEVAAKGERVIGAAFKKMERSARKIEKDDLKGNVTFLGIAGIIDPPRDEVIDAIEECKSAGINVKMITGDHAITACTIGKQIGIGDGKKVMTGKELEKMSDDQFREVVGEYDVYARTSPEHKLKLVTALQSNGKLCAMTGDGVNDAPALKKANIGIAMGIKGTEVSKDASEMVLTDDNFATIVCAVEEGRTVYDNIRKSLLFILPTNGAEALVLMSAILLGIIMPITPAQILWVNMVTAVTLALAIAVEPMEDKIMERPPRKPGEAILGKLFIWRITFVSILIGGLTMMVFNYMLSSGADVTLARTVAVNTLVAGQLFYLFNCRKIRLPSLGKGFFDNKYIFIAAGALIVLQMVFVYIPFMNLFFDTAPLEPGLWLFPLGAGLAVFFLVELEKSLIEKFRGDTSQGRNII
jgi:P-type Ca2+ transporter type 2C